MRPLIDYGLYVTNTDATTGQSFERFIGEGSIDLPTVEITTVELGEAGMAGKLKMPLLGQTEAMEVKIGVPSIHGENIRAAIAGGQMITARLAAENLDKITKERTIIADVIVMQGFNSSIGLGKVEKGSGRDASYTYQVHYLKLVSDGTVLLEHSVLDGIHIVDGVDQYAGVREAI